MIEKIKKAVKIGKSYIDGTLPEHLKETLRALVKLAEDYLAISDSKLLPKEKECYLNAGKNIYYNEEKGFNVAIHECKLRHLKNKMSVEEIVKVLAPNIDFKSIEKLSPKGHELLRVAHAISDAMEKKMEESDVNNRSRLRR